MGRLRPRRCRVAAGALVGSLGVQLYLLGAEQLHDVYGRAAGERHAYEAKLHTQPDSRCILTLPGVIRAVVAAACREAEGKTADELRKMAEQAGYLADRVSTAKRSTPTPTATYAGVKALQQRAEVWTQLADQAQ